MLRWLLLLSVLWMSGVQATTIETYRFDTPEKEDLYKRMIAELRCLVCQNQNLADSNAELAQDLRRKTYELIKAGKNETEIISYMVQRYGDFVLYRPPFKNTTIFLWVGPFIILAIGMFVVIRVIRRRAKIPAEDALTNEQLAKAESLLKGDDKKLLKGDDK